MVFCKKCGTEIKSGKVCMSCVNEAQVELVEIITKANWNFGSIAKELKRMNDMKP